MSKFEITEVHIEEEPKFDDPKLLMAEEKKGVGYRYGILGYVKFILIVDENETAHTIPILLDLKWQKFTSVGTKNGMPVSILVSPFAYKHLSKNKAFSFIIWHECGHIANGDCEKEIEARCYLNEHLADVYAADHVGYDNAIKALRCINFLTKGKVRESTSKELAFRASDLGDEAASRAIKDKGWVRPEIYP